MARTRPLCAGGSIIVYYCDKYITLPLQLKLTAFDLEGFLCASRARSRNCRSNASLVGWHIFGCKRNGGLPGMFSLAVCRSFSFTFIALDCCRFAAATGTNDCSRRIIASTFAYVAPPNYSATRNINSYFQKCQV